MLRLVQFLLFAQVVMASSGCFVRARPGPGYREERREERHEEKREDKREDKRERHEH
jgi:hypothetical protein